MAQQQSTPSQAVALARPACPQCGSLMWLARISPEGPDHDRRTFECPACAISETVVVKFK
jgi:hypothetical protein